MRDFHKILGGPVGRFVFIVFAIYAIGAATLGPAVTISVFDTATVGVGLVFCFYVAREVCITLREKSPERAQLWATGSALVLGSTVAIRLMRIYWTITEQPWIAYHWSFGVVTASQWAGFVLCLAALVAPDNGTIFRGTRRPMMMAAAVTVIFILASILARAALRPG